MTNDSQAGAALKAKPEKSEEKDSSGFASSQPNHIYFCCRHGIEHPSPLFLLHPSPYAREDWQWDGAAGGVVVKVSLIALKSGEFRLLSFTPQHRKGHLALDTMLCSKSTRPLVTHPGRIILHLISSSNHVLNAIPQGLCFYSQKEREKCHLTCRQVVTPNPGDLRTPFSIAPEAAGAIYQQAENMHSSWLECLAQARHLLEPFRQWDHTQ